MEIRTVIELADKVDTRLVSDHIINLLQGVRGRMIGDRDKMLAVIDGYLESSPEEKMMFQAARRMAMVTSPKEMERLPQREKTIIKQMVDSAKDGPYEWEIRMNSLISRYI